VRTFIACLAAAALLAAVACSGDDGGSGFIPLTVEPTAVAPGDTFTVTAEIGEEWVCATTITYPGVGAIRGGAGGFENAGGRQRWTRQVPDAAQPGRAPIRVYCQQTGRGTWFAGVGTGLAEVQVVAP